MLDFPGKLSPYTEVRERPLDLDGKTPLFLRERPQEYTPEPHQSKYESSKLAERGPANFLL